MRLYREILGRLVVVELEGTSLSALPLILKVNGDPGEVTGNQILLSIFTVGVIHKPDGILNCRGKTGLNR